MERPRRGGRAYVGAESGETAAQSLECGDSGGHVPPPRLGCESETVRDTGVGKSGQQVVLFDRFHRDDRPSHVVGGGGFGRSRDVAEQIELLHLATRIGTIPK